jgi:hypothetical protein
MSKWRISYIGKVGRDLGLSDAATADAARQQAIDFYHIEPAQQFRLVAVEVVQAKKPAREKVGAKS